MSGVAMGRMRTVKATRSAIEENIDDSLNSSFIYTEILHVHKLLYSHQKCCLFVIPCFSSCCLPVPEEGYLLYDDYGNQLDRVLSLAVLKEVMVNKNYRLVGGVEKCEAPHKTQSCFKMNNFTPINCLCCCVSFYSCNFDRAVGGDRDILAANIRNDYTPENVCCYCNCNCLNGSNGRCPCGHDEAFVCRKILCFQCNQKYKCEVYKYAVEKKTVK
jgi:hypothetical protein